LQQVWIASDSPSAYNLAVKIEVARDNVVKGMWTLDSLVRVGPLLLNTAQGLTTKDSLVIGRSIHFDLVQRYAGANKFRVVAALDTTQAAVTNLGTDSYPGAKLRVGVTYAEPMR
jgi:hypothetical protein